MLEEALDKALAKTIYWHQIALLESSRRILEDNARQMFRAQAYDVLLAVFEADLSEATQEEKDKRKAAIVMAAIAAALAKRLSRDVQTLRPGLVAALTTAVIHSGLAKYGIKGDLHSLRAEEWLAQHGAELVKGINDYTREQMAGILADGLARGQSVEDIASRLTGRFEDMTYARARRIALTETSKAWSFAEMESANLMERAGYKMVKEWLLGPLHPRYDFCDHNHEAGAIPITQPFPMGDMAPPQHPNCGCSLITYPAGGDQPWGVQVLGQTPWMPFGFEQGDINAA